MIGPFHENEADNGVYRKVAVERMSKRQKRPVYKNEVMPDIYG